MNSATIEYRDNTAQDGEGIPRLGQRAGNSECREEVVALVN